VSSPRRKKQKQEIEKIETVADTGFIDLFCNIKDSSGGYHTKLTEKKGKEGI